MVENDTTSNIEVTEARSEEEILAEAEAVALELARMEEERRRVMEDLALSIEKKFEERQKNRRPKEAEWLESTKLWLGSLAVGDETSRNPDRPWNPSSGRHRPDRNIVRIKCDIAVAQQSSMQFSGGEKNWDIEPPAIVVDMEPAQAAAAAMEMEKTIQGQLNATRYGAKCRSAMWDRVVLGSGILKGPVNTGKLKTTYKPVEGGMYVPELTTEYTPELERVDPWFAYPDDSTNDVCSLGDFLETHPYSRLDLSKLKKNPGFISEEIDELLKEQPKEYTNDSFADFAKLTDSSVNLFKNKYLVIEYHGPITLDQLSKLDIEPAYDSPSEEYYGEVWTCQGRIIRLELSNIEGVYETPYAMVPWKKDPSSVFGFSLPLLLRDHQRVTTQAWHMVLDNSSVSSGPQVIMQKNAIEPMNGKWDIDPYKIWLHTDYGTPIEQAFHFYVPPNVSQDLLSVLQVTAQFAEEEGGVSMMSAGLGSPQVSDSATGSAIMNQNSSLLGDSDAEAWDDAITEKIIRRFYAWNMQYNPNPAIKGNFNIDVKSSTEYKNKLLVLRDVERLSMEAAQNPELAIALNMEELTKARLAMMSLPNQNVVRSPEEIAQIRQQQAEAAQNQIDPNMLQMKELEIKERQIALQEQQLAFEKQQQQMREMMDHEEKMSANYARIAEAEAQAIRTQNEKEIALIRMAQEQGIKMAELETKMGIATINDSTTKFLGGLDSVRKNREQLLKEREYSYALENGKGFL